MIKGKQKFIQTILDCIGGICKNIRRHKMVGALSISLEAIYHISCQ